MTAIFLKDPTARLDYGEDWSDWLASGETLSTVTATVPEGITGEAVSHTTTQTSQYFSGGTLGVDYVINHAVVSSAGRADNRDFIIRIAERSLVEPTGPTVSTLITDALKTIGVIASGETVEAALASDALSRLTALMDGWATQRLTIYTIARTVKTLTLGTASYTIGTGGTISLARPQWIDHAMLIIDSTAATTTEIPLMVYTDDQWASVRQKSLTSPYVQGIYYDHSWTAGLGVIFVWPVPTSGTTQLVLYTPQALTAVTSLTDPVSFPPGYQRFVRLALARELAPEYGKPFDARLEQMYSEAMADVKRANVRLTELATDAALWPRRPGLYNIFTDTYGR